MSATVEEYIEVLNAEQHVDLQKLRDYARHGVPPEVRGEVWLYLLGVLSADKSEEITAVREKYAEYDSLDKTDAEVEKRVRGEASRYYQRRLFSHNGRGGSAKSTRGMTRRPGGATVVLKGAGGYAPGPQRSYPGVHHGKNPYQTPVFFPPSSSTATATATAAPGASAAVPGSSASSTSSSSSTASSSAGPPYVVGAPEALHLTTSPSMSAPEPSFSSTIQPPIPASQHPIPLSAPDRPPNRVNDGRSSSFVPVANSHLLLHPSAQSGGGGGLISLGAAGKAVADSMASSSTGSAGIGSSTSTGGAALLPSSCYPDSYRDPSAEALEAKRFAKACENIICAWLNRRRDRTRTWTRTRTRWRGVEGREKDAAMETATGRNASGENAALSPSVADADGEGFQGASFDCLVVSPKSGTDGTDDPALHGWWGGGGGGGGGAVVRSASMTGVVVENASRPGNGGGLAWDTATEVEYSPELVHLCAPFVRSVRVEAGMYFAFEALMGMLEDYYAAHPLAERVATFMSLFRTSLPDLHAYFEEEEVDINEIVTGWLRFLFAREMRVENLMRLWDTYFATPDPLDLHLYVCVAILTDRKDALEELDQSESRSMLLSLPELDVNRIINEALNIRLSHRLSQAADEVEMVER